MSRASLLHKQVNKLIFSDLSARRHQLRGLSAAVSRCHTSLPHRCCLAAKATALSWKGYAHSCIFIYFELSLLQVPPRSLSSSTAISIYSHLKYSWLQKQQTGVNSLRNSSSSWINPLPPAAHPAPAIWQALGGGRGMGAVLRAGSERAGSEHAGREPCCLPPCFHTKCV